MLYKFFWSRIKYMYINMSTEQNVCIVFWFLYFFVWFLVLRIRLPLSCHFQQGNVYNYAFRFHTNDNTTLLDGRMSWNDITFFNFLPSQCVILCDRTIASINIYIFILFFLSNFLLHKLVLHIRILNQQINIYCWVQFIKFLL